MDRLHRVKMPQIQHNDGRYNPLPKSTQLQLGQTAAVLLHLQPHLAYTTNSTSSSDGWGNYLGVDGPPEAKVLRHYVLQLLCGSCLVVNMKAGQLVTQMVSDAAAAAAAAKKAALQQTPAAGSSSSADVEQPSIAAAVTAAEYDISHYTHLLSNSQYMTPRQRALFSATQPVPPGLKLPKDRPPDVEGLSAICLEESQSQLLAWEATVVAQVAFMSATAVAAPAALEAQEPPNTLECLVLTSLCRHAVVLQQMPAIVHPAFRQFQGNLCQIPCQAVSLQQVAVALDVIAVQQQYSSRFDFLQYHASAWLWHWFSMEQTVEELLLLEPLICPAEVLEAATAQTAGADLVSRRAALRLIACYGSSIVRPLLFLDLQPQLQALADTAGIDAAALTSRFHMHVFGLIFPVLKTPSLSARVKKVAAVLGNVTINVSVWGHP
jgi:hypothetical protein